MRFDEADITDIEGFRRTINHERPDKPGITLLSFLAKACAITLKAMPSFNAALARDGKLKAADMEGGCFTISSLVSIRGTGFTPIINAPELAILGVARAQMNSQWNGEKFLPRLLLPLCLSWDHRALDGVAAARFLRYLAALLEDFRRISL